MRISRPSSLSSMRLAAAGKKPRSPHVNTPLQTLPHPERKNRTRWILLGAAIVVVLVIAWRRHGESAAADAHPNAHAAIRVETAAAMRKDVPIYLEGLGTVQAYYTVTITARVDGQLQKVGFVEGQTLQKGALIPQIAPRPFQAALDLAVAVKAKAS